jgi:hypothetical protein
MDIIQYNHILQVYSSLNQNEYIVDTTKEMIIMNEEDVYITFINTYYPYISELFQFMM